MNNLESSIITVKELLQTPKIKIPDYQRPYKWTEKNVNQLIDDILFFKNEKKSAYHLGTVVIHKDKDGDLNIVDGQQRTVTLTLIIRALIKNNKLAQIKGLSDFTTDLTKLSFQSDISKANIQNNYKVIERRIIEFDEYIILFLFNNCKFVKANLLNISEAFQFFDSQNARGKDLKPHDLLKAFHLREMNNSSTEKEKQKTVENWEEMDDKGKLSELFADYLYRIKNWSMRRSAMYFTKDDVDIFKGVNLEVWEDYPFAKMLRIAHYYTEEYNQSPHAKINKNRQNYPFQIDQIIINGKRFFEMVAYYNKLIGELKEIKGNIILDTIKNYPGCNSRAGDIFTRNLFFCALIYYIDKFGGNNLDKAVDKLFIWAYTLRLKSGRFGIKSVDKYALNDQQHSKMQLFEKIKNSFHPNDILNIELEVLKQDQLGMEIPEIIELLKERKYYE